MNMDQQEAFLATFEQAGAAKVRKAIGNDHWPREVHDLAQNWLSAQEESEWRRQVIEHEQLESVRSATEAASAANRLAEDAKTLARDANVAARAASTSAEQSERNAKIASALAAAALAVAIAALIASAWPK
jgi:hypothetical protein